MSLHGYLERVDSGENILVQDMYRSQDYQEIVDLLEEGQINGAYIEIDRDTANDIMDRKALTNAKETLESVVSTVLETPYDEGFEKGDRAVRGVSNSERIADKAQKKESKVKATEAGMGAGAVGTITGANLGSVHLTGGSAFLGVISGIFNSKYQGMRDAEMEQAAEGLESAYGGHQLRIR